MRILVADDEADVRVLIRFIFEQRGNSVIEASSGAEALALARSELPDMVLLDVMMPEMSGYEVCHQLRAEEATKDIPVIFLSAKGQSYEVAEGLAQGADAYIVKPFSAKQLAGQVEEVLQRSRERV